VIVGVDSEALVRLARMVPQTVGTYWAVLVAAGIPPGLADRAVKGDDSPRVGDWCAEPCLVLSDPSGRAYPTVDVSCETGLHTWPASYLRGLPLIDTDDLDSVWNHRAAML